MEPIVNGVKREFRGELRVIQVNIQDPRGRELAERYQFEFTPTFIFFNGDGDEVWRMVGRLDADRLRESLP